MSGGYWEPGYTPPGYVEGDNLPLRVLQLTASDNPGNQRDTSSSAAPHAGSPQSFTVSVPTSSSRNFTTGYQDQED